MKSYRVLAWKELKQQRITSILVLTAIVLSTVMTTAIGQSLGILKAMQIQQSCSLSGNKYATFHNLDLMQVNELNHDSRISWLGGNIPLGNAKLKDSGISLSLNEYDNNGIKTYPTIFQLAEGSLPKSAGEIALSANTLKLLGYTGKVGDSISLNLSVSLLRDNDVPYEYNAEFKLSGILVDNYLGYSSGLVVGTVGSGTAEQLLPEKYLRYSVDFIIADSKNFQDIVTDLAYRLNINENLIEYNWLYLNALGIEYYGKDEQSDSNSGISYMAVAGFLVGILFLIAAGMVIYNIMKISVSKKLKEYGILRAIGAEKTQLYLLVTIQIFLLCGIGIPLGSVLGILSASTITKAATSSFAPSIFMAQSTEELTSLILQNNTPKLLPLILSAIITLIFAFLAALPSAHYASKVSPALAMKSNVVSIKRKKRKDKYIRNFEAYYATLNLKRNIHRTIITILSLVMSITVFIALQSFSKLLDTSKEVQKLHLGDYSITNDTIGFEPTVLKDLYSLNGISYVYTLKYSLYQQDSNGTLPIETNVTLNPSETLQIIGIDEERLKILMPSLTDENIQDLKLGKACLIKNPITFSYNGVDMETTSYTLGDTLSVGDTELHVLGNCDAIKFNNEGFINGVQIIVFDKIYDYLTGKSFYSEFYPVLENKENIDYIEQKFEDICSQVTGSHWLSYQNTDEQLEESYQQIKLLSWGLILFIGLIGLLNIINTIYTTVHTRVNEIGIQRAIGMSKKSLYKTFLWEGIFYGIIASIIGAITGYVCTIFVEAASTDIIQLVAFPINSVVQITIITILLCFITTCFPLQQIAKISIVDSIETVE